MHGLYLLWWVQEKQMPPAIVAVCLAAGDLLLLAVEWPTGWFADRFGYRRSLIAGSAVQAIGMLWCWLGEGAFGLVVASVLIALGDGFRSGADQALLYRTCVALGREGDFQRIEARAAALETTALVLLVLAGGLVVSTWGFAAGWIAETLLSTAGIALAGIMVEPPATSPEATEGRAAMPRVLPPRLTAVMAPAALLGGFAGVTAFLAQTSPGLTPAMVTFVVAGITLADAAGAAIASRLAATHREQVVLLTAGVVLLATALIAPGTLLACATALAFAHGVASPLRATLVQRLADDGMRARLASLASASDMAVSTIALPLGGYWRQRRR